jgi:hypothetical protein
VRIEEPEVAAAHGYLDLVVLDGHLDDLARYVSGVAAWVDAQG